MEVPATSPRVVRTFRHDDLQFEIDAVSPLLYLSLFLKVHRAECYDVAPGSWLLRSVVIALGVTTALAKQGQIALTEIARRVAASIFGEERG
jgi:hypothetical protein